MSNPVVFFDIYVNDIARAKKFYEAVFGVSLEKVDDPTDSTVEMMFFPSEISQYGCTGSIVKRDGCPAGGGNTIIYFACEDCAVEEARVEDAGGKIVQSKFAIGQFGFCVVVIDSEGNTIGLHSEK